MAMALTARRRWVARHDRATGAEDGAEPDVSVHCAVQHTAAALPFASVAGHRIVQRRKPKAAQRARAHAPVMTLASAGGAAAPPVDAPRWRVVLGNLAAGATAGAAVEAGARKRVCTMPMKAAVDASAAARGDGLGCLAALYPLDTLKTRLQAMSSGGGLRALLQSGGGKALYAGLVGNLAGVVPASAIFMGVYEPVKGATGRRVRDDRQFLAPLAGGVAAGFAASVVRVPTEVVKQRMQTGACCVSNGLSPGFARACVATAGSARRRVPRRAASGARHCRQGGGARAFRGLWLFPAARPAV